MYPLDHSNIKTCLILNINANIHISEQHNFPTYSISSISNVCASKFKTRNLRALPPAIFKFHSRVNKNLRSGSIKDRIRRNFNLRLIEWFFISSQDHLNNILNMKYLLSGHQYKKDPHMNSL